MDFKAYRAFERTDAAAGMNFDSPQDWPASPLPSGELTEPVPILGTGFQPQ
jgi:hypothetical protein